MKRALSILLCTLLTVSFSSALLSPPVYADDTDTIPISQFVADNHVLMTRADGRMIGWGDNTYGQLGLGDTAETSYTEPVEITFFVGKGKIRQIAVIKDTSFVLLSNGELYSAGSGLYGKHGQGNTYNQIEWGRVGGELKFKKLYTNAAAEFALAEDYSGSLYAWGKNADGQLGVGDTDARTSPALVVENASVKNLWLGESYVEYVDLDGGLYYWGTNDKGQMGLSSAYTKTTHTQTRYSNGNRENINTQNVLVFLNPDYVDEPTQFDPLSVEEVISWSTDEPDPPAAGQAAFTKLKYNIELPRKFTLTTSDFNGVGGGYPYITESSRTGSSSNGYVHHFKDVPERIYFTSSQNRPFSKIYMLTGNDAGKTFTSSDNTTATKYMYYLITEKASYTCKEWFTGKTHVVGPSTNPDNSLFRDAYSGEFIVDQTGTQTIYFYKISLPTDYTALPATEYSLGVSAAAHQLIQENQGLSIEQEWYDYSWNHRTLFDTNKNIGVLSGANHSMAIIDNKIYGWGDASKKQLGVQSQVGYPVELTQLNALIASQMAAGVNQSGLYIAGNSNYITFDDGSVWVWGDNSYNKSGASGAPVNIDTPTKVTALQDVKITKVVAGRNTNYYITEDGDIYASGSNINGVTGLGKDYSDEATIDTPTKLGAIGYSETLEPPSADSVQITVPEKAESGKTIEVIWNAVNDANRYELKRTVVLKNETNADDMMAKTQEVEVSTMAFVPRSNGLSDFLSFLSTNSTPQTVYTGNQTTYTDTAQSTWQSVTYELKAVNRIGDYSAPVQSKAVSIIETANNGGNDDNTGKNNNTGGNHSGGDSNSKVTVPPVNVTVNPPEVTVRSPEISVQSPDIVLNYPELQSSAGTTSGSSTTGQTSGYSWMPTPEQLARLGLSFGGNSSGAPYVITIEPSTPQYVQPANSSSSTLLYVIIFVLLTVVIGGVMFVLASFLFNKNGMEVQKLRFMLSSVLADADD